MISVEDLKSLGFQETYENGIFQIRIHDLIRLKYDNRTCFLILSRKSESKTWGTKIEICLPKPYKTIEALKSFLNLILC